MNLIVSILIIRWHSKELNILHISCLLLNHTGNERLVRINKKNLSIALTSLQVIAKKTVED